MKTLLIIAHPKEKSTNRTIFEFVKKDLKQKGNELRIIDLYKDNFECRIFLSKEEEKEKLFKKYQEDIKWSKRIIFFFPIWWQSYPAVLKGFFDKILSPDFAFKYGKTGFPIGLLKGREAVVIRTFGGPYFFSKMTGFGSWGALKTGTLKFCGIKPVKKFDLYKVNMKGFNQDSVDKFLNKLHKNL
jgi:NAD(P)H dehydrogenase (quinone)